MESSSGNSVKDFGESSFTWSEKDLSSAAGAREDVGDGNDSKCRGGGGGDGITRIRFMNNVSLDNISVSCGLAPIVRLLKMDSFGT